MFELLTIPQVAARLGVTRQRVDQWRRAGRLKATRYGPVWLVKPQDARRPDPLPPGRPQNNA